MTPKKEFPNHRHTSVPVRCLGSSKSATVALEFSSTRRAPNAVHGIPRPLCQVLLQLEEDGFFVYS